MNPYRPEPPAFPAAPPPRRRAAALATVLLGIAVLAVTQVAAHPWCAIVLAVGVGAATYLLIDFGEALGRQRQHREWLKAFGPKPPPDYTAEAMAVPASDVKIVDGTALVALTPRARVLLASYMADRLDDGLVRVVDTCARATGQHIESAAQARKDWDELLDGMRERDENEHLTRRR
jgi:hypothetical protein